MEPSFFYISPFSAQNNVLFVISSNVNNRNYMENNMFCFQCQETANGKACTVKGVCGKSALLSNKMDLLMFVARGVATVADSLCRKGRSSAAEVNKFITDALTCTVTNTNFCQESIIHRIKKGLAIREKLKEQARELNIALPYIPEVEWHGTFADENNMREAQTGITREKDVQVRSLKELITYGLKGICAYHGHAMRLGYSDEKLHCFTLNALHRISLNDISVMELTGLVIETGEQGLKVMELLDRAHTESFGHPQITKVSTGVRDNPGILVSGHDLDDLYQLLEQTQGTGVDVYTHGEMLPGHYYPSLKKFRHFAGNYGNSWWEQCDELERFNGPVIFTSNCIVPPVEGNGYIDRMFTCNSSGYPGCRHIASDKFGKKDFSQIIALALKCNPPQKLEKGEITGGFAHEQLIDLMDIIGYAVKCGDIRKFVVMAGCDGRQKKRSYYSTFAQKLPHDCVIITAGCAKYRFNKLGLGDINGIPRLLDAGQCNDVFSIVLIAKKLMEVLGVKNINSLPLAYNIAWYEQKAVIVLLALLSLGVRNIIVGPTLPAFMEGDIMDTLKNHFGIKGISSPDEDMRKLGIV